MELAVSTIKNEQGLELERDSFSTIQIDLSSGTITLTGKHYVSRVDKVLVETNSYINTVLEGTPLEGQSRFTEDDLKKAQVILEAFKKSIKILLETKLQTV